MNLKKIYIISIIFCLSLTLFADDAVQDTNYYDLKVIVDGINRIEGKLTIMAVPQKNYSTDGRWRGFGNIREVDSYTMEDTLVIRRGEYCIITYITLDDNMHQFFIRDNQYAFSRINDKELDLDIKHGEPQIIWPAFEDIKISIPETKVIRLILSNNKPK